MQFERNAHYSLFRVWELGVSFLGRLSCQYSRATKIMLPISLGIRSRMIAPIIDMRELGAKAGAVWKLAANKPPTYRDYPERDY
jgi:hypothetical protein